MKRLDNYVKMIGGVAGVEYTAVASAYATLIQEIELAFTNPVAAAIVTPNETIAAALARAAAAALPAAAPGGIDAAYAASLRRLANNALRVVRAAIAAEAAASATNTLINAAVAAADAAAADAAAADADAAAVAAAGAAAAALAAPRLNEIIEAHRVALLTVEQATIAARAAARAAGARAAALARAAAAARAARAGAPPAPPAAAPAPQAVYYDSGPAEPTSFNVSVYRTKDGKDSFVGTRPAYPSTSVKTILDGLKQSGETVIVSSGEQFVKSLHV